ncbi:MAG: AraC family transcriptional regulator [Anaerolineae bacterium]|nr:AraC family transcriptional regulator [Anaerolineae bacterium]
MAANPEPDQHTLIDCGTTWHLSSMHNLRFLRARYIQHTFSPHAHDYFVLGIVENGLQSFDYKKDRLITPPGKVIIINPQEIHTGRAAVDSGFTYRALYPSIELMEAISDEFGHKTPSIPQFRGGLIDDRQIFYWLQQLHHLSQTSSESIALEEKWNAFFIELIRRHADGHYVLPHYQAAHRAVNKIREYIDAYYANKIALADLSQLAHISPYHLTRLFQRQMGVSPHKYLENIRIKHAENLLDAGMALVDVAYATGFSSQSHFTRTFKRFLGTTPGEYVKKRKIV